MKTKLIGVTPRILYEGKVRKQFVNERYLRALIERGFNTIMLTLDNPNLTEILNLCDGFLITGGFDIDPKYFNEENVGLSKSCDLALDIVDKMVVEYAKEHQLPLLGICRGHQAINVFLGGSLHQDIGKTHEDTRHQVKSTKNKVLAFPETFETNSYHHQAIKALAPGLEIIARSQDDTVEAVVHQNLPIIGVQWHPEIEQQDANSKLIFDRFAAFFKE